MLVAEKPTTATGTASRNVADHAIAITVFSTCKWWARLWLPLVFAFARLFPRSRSDLAELSFIHFARWTLVHKLPQQRLRYRHLFFESNFNGGWEEYIDAFSHVLTKGMTTFWGSSYGFPKPLPTAPFKEYIRANEIEVSHFYAAYPQATTTMVLQALELDERFAAFKRRAATLEGEAFAAEWRRFLTEAQGCL
jgi:hypothetical protein